MSRKNSDIQPTQERLPVEVWRERLATPAWLWAAARVKSAWAVGQELTEQEYRAAVQEAAQEVIRNA